MLWVPLNMVSTTDKIPQNDILPINIVKFLSILANDYFAIIANSFQK